MPRSEVPVIAGRSPIKVIHGNTIWKQIHSNLGMHFLLMPSGNICITVGKSGGSVSISQKRSGKWILLARPASKALAFVFVETHLPVILIYSPTQQLNCGSKTSAMRANPEKKTEAA